MFAKPLSRQSFWQIITFLIVTSMLILLAASLLAASLVSASNIEPQGVSQPPYPRLISPSPPARQPTPIFFNSGNTDINFSFTIIGATSASASLTVFNAANSNIWSGSAGGGETLWGSSTLTNGNNRFSIVNTGAESVSLTLKLFRVPALQAPTPTYSWMGKAAPAGLNSKIKLNFPTSGLYTFDFSVNAGGRYEFLLGTDKDPTHHHRQRRRLPLCGSGRTYDDHHPRPGRQQPGGLAGGHGLQWRQRRCPALQQKQ
ncbi:MAG: hypothetical protein M5U34_30180 [Chloroflexi bacterium]|nr:hypothetical protein [Chloroflexota bacterium]